MAELQAECRDRGLPLGNRTEMLQRLGYRREQSSPCVSAQQSPSGAKMTVARLRTEADRRNLSDRGRRWELLKRLGYKVRKQDIPVSMHHMYKKEKTAAELRATLKRLGQPTTGTKAEMARRLREMLQIFVQVPNHESPMPLFLSPDTTMREIKNMVGGNPGKLIYAGRELDDNRTLADLHIQESTKFYYVASPR